MNQNPYIRRVIKAQFRGVVPLGLNGRDQGIKHWVAEELHHEPRPPHTPKVECFYVDGDLVFHHDGEPTLVVSNGHWEWCRFAGKDKAEAEAEAQVQQIPQPLSTPAPKPVLAPVPPPQQNRKAEQAQKRVSA